MVAKVGFSFARILGVSSDTCNGLRQRQLFSFFCNCNLRSSTGLNYTTTAEVAGCKTDNHVLVDYLTESLNFSRDDAVSIAVKLAEYKSQKSPALAIDYLKRIGMEKTYIKAVVSKFPKLLFRDPDKNLRPKIQCLQEHGLSGSDLVNFIAKHPYFLARGLETHLRPVLHFLRQTVGSNQNTVTALKRYGWLLSTGNYKNMEENVVALRDMGFSDERIQQFVMVRPRCLNKKSGWIGKILRRVEMEFGISRNNPMFYSAVCVATSLRKSTMDKKLEILRNFGWSNSEIFTMVQKQPWCLNMSEARLKKVLNFLMNELGYGSDYLAFRPLLIVSSLEKRIIPRNQVLKILKENQLTDCSLFSAMSIQESKFFVECVLRYKDKFPEMYHGYKKSVSKKNI